MESSGSSSPAATSAERGFAASLTARYSDWVIEELDELGGSFLLTDPAMPGHPIVYASRGLPALTGYPRRDVLGRNARLFQGAATCRAAVAGLREAVRGQRAHQVAILNYRRDGSPHWVLLHVAPVFHAADGRVLHFLAVQVPIAPATRRGACRGPAIFAACREEARVEEELPCAAHGHAGEVFVDIDKRGQFDSTCLLLILSPTKLLQNMHSSLDHPFIASVLVIYTLLPYHDLL
jgi:PAS domain S-box-containing protein